MQASDVMTCDLVTVHPADSLGDAVQRMVDHRISGLPVVDDGGALVGILTEGDLLRRVETGTETQHSTWWHFLHGPATSAADYIETHSRRVADVMTTAFVSVAPETPLPEIVALMQQHGVRRLPVLAGGRLAGLVTRADLVRALARSLRAAQAGPGDDAAVLQRLRDELASQPWFVPEQVKLSVARGVVTLEGVFTDGASHEALLVAARNTPGVASVRDLLTFVSPVGSINA